MDPFYWKFTIKCLYIKLSITSQIILASCISNFFLPENVLRETSIFMCQWGLYVISLVIKIIVHLQTINHGQDSACSLPMPAFAFVLKSRLLMITLLWNNLDPILLSHSESPLLNLMPICTFCTSTLRAPTKMEFGQFRKMPFEHKLVNNGQYHRISGCSKYQ